MRQLHIEVIDRAYAAILATKTPAEKVSMVAQAYRTARMLAEAGARYLHPDWTDEQIRAEVTRRMTPSDIRLAAQRGTPSEAPCRRPRFAPSTSRRG